MFRSIAIFSILFSASIFAADQQISISVEEFLNKQVAQNCGYWVEREIEVCDERAVYDNVPYKQCKYNRTYTTTPSAFPSNYTIDMELNQQCYPNKTLGVPGHTPHANYVLTGEETKYRQVSRTERYNCRLERRMVWVPGNPHQCNNPDY